MMRQPLFFGSPTWTRTRDLRINSPSLYRLSYQGIDEGAILMIVGVLVNTRNALKSRIRTFLLRDMPLSRMLDR